MAVGESWERPLEALEERVTKIEKVVQGNGEPSQAELIRTNTRDIATIKRFCFAILAGVVSLLIPLVWTGVSALIRAGLAETVSK